MTARSVSTALLVGLAPTLTSAQPVATAHPAEMMEYAAQIFGEGQRDEAVFWFYLGQLRFRALLTSKPDLDPSGEPAVFSALMATLGPPINEWAFGDLEELASTIDRVLAFDEANPDNSLPAAVVQQTRSGLEEMRNTLLAQADQIRSQRVANGLENR